MFKWHKYYHFKVYELSGNADRGSLCLPLLCADEPVSEEPVPELSDSEEEIDFGFWEKASMPTSSGSSTSERGQHGQTELPQEADLGLL